jgi:hypothetical protein
MAQEVVIGTAGSSEQSATEIYVGTSGSSIQNVVAGYVGTVGSGRQIFFSNLSVTVSPGVNSKSGASSSFVFNPATVATVTGGSGSYSYNWTLEPINATWSFISGQNGPAPVVQVTGAGSDGEANLRLTVTDLVSGITAPGFASLIYTRT